LNIPKGLFFNGIVVAVVGGKDSKDPGHPKDWFHDLGKSMLEIA